MRRILTLVAFLTLLCGAAEARHALHINHPRKPAYGRQGAVLQDVSCEVWPAGAYARVELTFTIGTTTAFNYLPTDSLESVLEFELPENSVVHNSWLWLTPTVIIQAAIIERSRAVQAYNAVVARNTDPSLLQQTGPEQYQLNVFPLLTSYPRKVRIFYATPLLWSGDRASIALPTSLFASSQLRPTIQVTAHHGDGFAAPRIVEAGGSMTATTSTSSTQSVPPAQYSGEWGLHLSYNTALLGGAMLAVQPAGTGGGTYQLVVDAAAVGPAKPARYATFVFDHYQFGSGVFSQAAALNHMRAALLTQLSPTDSFSVFYEHAGAVMQVGGARWIPAHPDTVLAMMATVPAPVTANSGAIEQLLKKALGFAAGKPAAQSVAVVFSNNGTVAAQSNADTVFNRVRATLGGSFPTRVDVINTATTPQWIGGLQSVVGDALWVKLTLASGGTRYAHGGGSYGIQTGGAYGYDYDLRVRTILKNILRTTGFHTTLYGIMLPTSTGLSYAYYDIAGPGRWNAHAPYAEVGKFAGTPTGGGVVVQYMSPSGIVADTLPVTMVGSAVADTLIRETWVHQYIARLQSYNNPAYTQECIDSSIRARVLCPLTAFLALENGDTVGVNPTGSNPVITGIGEEPLTPAKDVWVTAAPNPFTDIVTLSFAQPAVSVQILDVTGRLVWSISAHGKQLRWTGTDAAGHALPAGVYLVRVQFADRIETLKVHKR